MAEVFAGKWVEEAVSTLEARTTELREGVEDLNIRVTDLEHFFSRLVLPSSSPSLSHSNPDDEERLEALDKIVADIKEIDKKLQELTDRLEALIAEVREESSSNPSRWVLELYPDEVEAWREALRKMPRERLTQKEQSFLRSMDYFILSERRVTIPQLSWIRSIAGRVGGRLPEIALVPAHSSESPSNPTCPFCGEEVPEVSDFCLSCYTPIPL